MPRFDTRGLESWEQDVAGLAGSLVHEVKNPLSTLSVTTQLLLEEWGEPHSPREKRMAQRLDVMRSEISRIEEIINSFLRYTRPQTLQVERTDINTLLTLLIAHNSEGMQRRDIRVHFQPGEDLAPLECDESLLRQAFLNLIRNAEQAMPEGGELIVRSRATGEGLEVEVIDTGVGIAADTLPRIFRPYFSSKPGGTGLGLATTLRIVRSHGGELRVESEPGKGSRFVVLLPASRGGAAAP
ncbi:MAG: PAS domain-containing sensor histidine kinase [Planctomycetota bacterium]